MTSGARVGDRFGRYEIVAYLGKGGMGEVYRVVDTLLGRAVALKILPVENLAGHGREETSARLLREARAAAALEHPNVIRIFDVGEVDGTPFLSMELVRGETLRALVKRTAIPYETRVTWLVGIAEALAAAHAGGVLHRDIKPENVMVGEDHVIKVLDFGIAAALHEDGSPASRPMGVAGTPSYMAPEQLRGEAIDARADQFAWGVVAFEVLTGMRPWSDESAEMLGAPFMLYEPPSPGASTPGIDDTLGSLIVRALALSAEDRFPSMRALLDVLRPIAARAPAGVSEASNVIPGASVPPEPAPAPALIASARSSRGKRGAALALSLACVALVLGLGRYVAGRRPPSIHPPPRAETSRTAHSGLSTESREARSAYAAAIQALRDVSYDAAVVELEKATAADPTFAEAHLRRVLYAGSWEDVREHYARALASRSRLGDHDRDLLDAFAPWMSVPPDLAETERRLVAIVAQAPDDAESHFFLCKMRYLQSDYEGSRAACEAASRLDPGFMFAMRYRGLDLASMGDVPGAIEAYDACIDGSPAAVLCLKFLFQLQALDGHCDQAMETVRRLIALEPSVSLYREYLVASLVATGAPAESVQQAIDQAIDRYPADQRAPEREGLDTRRAILEGRFEDAARAAAREEVLFTNEPKDVVHAHVTARRIGIARELGRPQEAIRLADDYLAKRAAWLQVPDLDDGFFAYTTKYRLGALSKAALVRRRDEWLAAQRSAKARVRIAPSLQWLFAYASTASTVTEAREALDLERNVGAIPAWARLPNVDWVLGETLFRAGRIDEAIAPLGHAAHSCLAWESPVESIWSRELLAEALEATGKRAEACAEYGVVIARFGASPGVTAARARARFRAAGCDGREKSAPAAIRR